MQVSEPALYILQRESPVLANQMKDYLSIRFDILNKLFGTNFPWGPTFNHFLKVSGGLINIFGRVDCLAENTKPLGDLRWAVTM